MAKQKLFKTKRGFWYHSIDRTDTGSLSQTLGVFAIAILTAVFLWLICYIASEYPKAYPPATEIKK